MPDVQTLSPRELERVRRRAARLADLDAAPGDERRLDETTAGALVALFGRLRVRDGLRLVTYVVRGGVGGTGWTFAIPAAAPAAPLDAVLQPGRDRPAPPPGALAHPMDAVAGDGSLRAYAQASILRRELAEIGAWWHGLSWSTHVLVGPSEDPGRPVVYSGGDLLAFPPTGMLDPAEWTWTAAPPPDWRPRAERGPDGGVTVTFWSYSELGAATVYEHRDVYPAGGRLVPSAARRRELGSGPGGYVF
jgi:hypothetical protein